MEIHRSQSNRIRRIVRFLALTCAVFLPMGGYCAYSVDRDYTVEVIPYGPTRFCEQGWPWVYLHRNGPSVNPGTQNPTGLSVAEFLPAQLALDLGVAAAFSVVLVVWLSWRRKRCRIWQFTLRELFAFSTLIALVLSWWAWEHARCRDELAAAAQLSAKGWWVAENPVVRPDPLMRLLRHVGLESPREFRPTGLVWDIDATQSKFQPANFDAFSQECGPLIQRLPHCRRLEIDAAPTLTDRGIEVFMRRMPRCNLLRLTDVPALEGSCFGAIATKWPDLEAIHIRQAGIGDKAVILMKDLPHLSTLSLAKVPKLTEAGVLAILEIPTLKDLTIPERLLRSASLEPAISARDARGHFTRFCSYDELPLPPCQWFDEEEEKDEHEKDEDP